jgi:hypothetical protein
MRSNAVGGGYCTLSLAWDGAVMMPLQYLQQFDSQDLTEDYQVGNGFLTKLQMQVPLFYRPKAEKTSRTSGFQTANQRRDFSGCVAFLT